MNRILDKNAILEKYPEKKPVCINYVELRGELLALADENEALKALLDVHIRQDRSA